jgi:SagB-type dehydrogenase family enzyme
VLARADAFARDRAPTPQLRDAQASAGLAQPPPLLITLASRFQRRSWKYAAIAYANTLKHVGVLYQTMYLVATAMGLAPCALGWGDADLFAAAVGTAYYAESSVGEFLLGSAPPGERS